MIDIKLPELGEGINEVEVSEILVKIGDKINNDDPIIVLETEKASMEIPSNQSGIVSDILIKKGDIISKNQIIIKLDSKLSSITEPKPEEVQTDEIQKTTITQPENSKSITEKSINENKPLSNSQDIGKPALASPSIRKLARELGCNLELIIGTGNKGRITQEDILNYVKNQLNTQNDEIKSTLSTNNLDFSKWGKINKQSLSKIKTITGKRLQDAWQSIPHVTQFDKCDITELENLRQKLKKINNDPSIKISFIPFFMKALCKILMEMPHFNSSLDETNDQLILKEYINIGIAVNTQKGLVVPVIKNVNNKTIKELSKELTLTSKNARNKKLSPSDMEGGCFTISSLGGIGGTYFTPIINPPEVAILGISKSIFEPVFFENKLKKRLMLPFSLSYDHRVIDGVDAAKFTKRFGDIITNLDDLV
ncbi:MAG: 2-oxo acid dehydrogenase subunit E2 [Candidatus Neomarinimicrobiota bacterium]|nr:2-oxo acid dehydrogenase subunit E2 [Candidatus Neomarinimicrobiota bacterium]